MIGGRQALGIDVAKEEGRWKNAKGQGKKAREEGKKEGRKEGKKERRKEVSKEGR